jgi:hypothetical protein
LPIVDTSALPEAFVKSTDLISAFSLFDDDLRKSNPETAWENWHVCESLLGFSSLLISPWNDDQLQATVSIGSLFGPLRVAKIVGLASPLPPDLWERVMKRDMKLIKMRMGSTGLLANLKKLRSRVR